MGVRAFVCAAIAALLPLAFGQTASKPQQIQAHLRQAQEYLKTNRPDLAAREFRAIVDLDPANVDARGNLGVLLFFQGDYAKAAPELRAAVKQKPDLWKLQALLGMAEKRTGQTAAARDDLEKTLPHIDETKLRVQTGLELIEIYFGSGDLDKAAAVIGGLRRLEPANTELLYTAHRIYSALADESLLTVAMLAPNSARMHQLMAHEMARQANREGAIFHYREALKLDPKLPGLHFELAEMLNGESAGAGQAEAEKEYRAALAVNPFDAKAESRLGEIAARRTELKEAYAHFSRALALQPNDADTNLGIARVLVLMKEPLKAEPYLKKAVELDPTNAVSHYRLAAIYRSSGRTEDARRELERFQRLKDMKERLKQIYRDMRLASGREEPPADER